MRAGRLDYETGKWVDDPPEVAAAPTVMPPAPSAPPVSPAPGPAPAQAPMSAADKARLLIQQRGRN